MRRSVLVVGARNPFGRKYCSGTADAVSLHNREVRARGQRGWHLAHRPQNHDALNHLREQGHVLRADVLVPVLRRRAHRPPARQRRRLQSGLVVGTSRAGV